MMSAPQVIVAVLVQERLALRPGHAGLPRPTIEHLQPIMRVISGVVDPIGGYLAHRRCVHRAEGSQYTRLSAFDRHRPPSTLLLHLWANVRAGQSHVILSRKFNRMQPAMVELRGIEPLTSSLRTRRSPN
jgi:hypothetical protein